MSHAPTATIVGSTAGRKQETVHTGAGYRLAEWLNENWADKTGGMTNQEVSVKLGYKSPNIVSMWRTGKTKVALDRLFQIADLMKVDVSLLLPLWLEAYMTDGDNVQRSVVGMKRIDDLFKRFATAHEMPLIKVFRDIHGKRDPVLSSQQLDAVKLVLSDPAAADLVLARKSSPAPAGIQPE